VFRSGSGQFLGAYLKKWIVLLFCLKTFSAIAADSFLDLNDVSILLPLPDAQSWSQLWSGETVGTKGAILPLKALDGVPRLVTQATNPALYPNIKVLGMRLDPCFHEGPAPAKCRPQVRLVWQPLKLEQNITSTYDASLHSFYDLTTEEFKSLLNEVTALKKTKTAENDFLPLGVNPFIKQEGLAGDYAQALRSIILKYIGEKNLARVTFMQLFMNEKTWMFGGFDFVNGESVPILVARTKTTFQIFNNSVPSDRPFWFLGGMNPAPPQDLENLGILVADSRTLAPQNEDEISAAVKTAFRFENPDMNNPGTVDCVSCHVAQPARSWALRQYPWLQLDVVYKDEIYSSERDLRNLSPMQPHTNILRSFGYFMNQPFVAQRTINESAAVIKYINENF
jgi:hypothetical protein